MPPWDLGTNCVGCVFPSSPRSRFCSDPLRSGNLGLIEQGHLCMTLGLICDSISCSKNMAPSSTFVGSRHGKGRDWRGKEEFGRCLGDSDVDSLVIWQVPEVCWIGGGFHGGNCLCAGEQNTCSGLAMLTSSQAGEPEWHLGYCQVESQLWLPVQQKRTKLLLISGTVRGRWVTDSLNHCFFFRSQIALSIEIINDFCYFVV